MIRRVSPQTVMLMLSVLAIQVFADASPVKAQDSNAPVQAITIRLETSASQIKVSWDPITDPDHLVGYIIRSAQVVPTPDPSQIGNVSCDRADYRNYIEYGTSCIASGFKPGRIYNITVEAWLIDPLHQFENWGERWIAPHPEVLLGTGERGWVSLCCQVPQAPLTPNSEDLGGGSAHVTWSAPAFSGGANTLTYDVTSTPPSAGCSTTELACTIPNLGFSTPYTFQVVARNSAGSSGAADTSTPLSLIPPSPGEPTGAKATMTGHVARVTWKAPADARKLAVTSYKVTASPGGKSCVSKKTSCAVKGLDFDTKYTFTVRAFRGSVASGLSRASLPVSYSPPPPPAPTPVTTPEPKPVPVLS